MQEAIFGLIGVLVGGFLSYLNSENLAKHEKQWQFSRLKHDKLIEIANISDKIQNSYFLIVTKLSTNSDISIDENLSVPINTLKVLIKFYAPELQDDLKILYGLREIFGQAFIDFTQNKNNKKHLQNLFVTSLKINKVCDEIYEKTVNIAKLEIDHNKDKSSCLDVSRVIHSLNDKIHSYFTKYRASKKI